MQRMKGMFCILCKDLRDLFLKSNPKIAIMNVGISTGIKEMRKRMLYSGKGVSGELRKLTETDVGELIIDAIHG